MLRMVHVWTLLPMVSGEDGSKEPILMLEFSIPMPPPTANLVYLPATASKSLWRSVHIKRSSARLLYSTSSLSDRGYGKRSNYKRLASCLGMKWDHSYSSTMSWLRCCLTFSLLRSAIQCIRGARSSFNWPGHLRSSLQLKLTVIIICMTYFFPNTLPCHYFVALRVFSHLVLSESTGKDAEYRCSNCHASPYV